MQGKKILITGASGFIGSFLVEGALERGMQTWAGVRKSSSKRYLQDARIHFATLDLNNPTALLPALEQHKEMYGGWDYVIHCAGVTKSVEDAGYIRGNYDATVNLVEGLRLAGIVPEKFIYISSLSIVGALREMDYTPITEQDTPRPNTIYGESKWRTEQYLHKQTDFSTVVFRPTAVYGPRDADLFLLVKSIRNHVDISAGFRRQDLTFVYVQDLVQAVFLGIEKGRAGRSYFVSDGAVYASRDYSDLVRKELGNPWLFRFTCPLWLLYGISFVAEKVAKCFGKVSTLNRDKYQLMKQRNWQCDISPLIEELGYVPQYPLHKGVPATIRWYKEEKWL